MYEILSSHDLTPEQAEGQKELLENAKAVQAKAYADKAELDANPPTEDEKKRWLENQVSDDELEIEDDDEEDDDEEDDEMLDVADEGEAEVKMVYGPAWDPETRMMTPRREEAPARAESDDEAVQIPGEQPLNAGEGAPGKAKSDDDEDVQMSEEQQVEGDQASQEQRRPPRVSAADRDIIAQGISGSGLATPAATRTATGNLRRTSRRKSGQ